MKQIYTSIALSLLTAFMHAQCLVQITSTNVQCNGQCDGTATATPVGLPPFNYLWQPGNMTTQTITGLCPGTYTVAVVDATSCTSTNTVTITEPAVLTATSTQVNATCNGACNGSATAFVTGGTASYTHKWSTSPVQTTATATGLCAGIYYDTITDANNCSIVLSPVTITEPAALTASVACSSVSCFGGADGMATVTQSGGTAGYTYMWAPGGSTSASITGLTPGTYTATVTDTNGCSTSANCTVNQPSAALNVSATTSVASCASCCDGTAMASASGGTAGYTYVWSPGGQTTASATGLCPGNYVVCATDMNGCVSCDTVSVNFSVGINEMLMTTPRFYPNPTSEDFEIEMNLPSVSDVTFTFFDAIGKEISTETVSANGNLKKKFTIQTLPAGVYFLRTGVAGKYFTHKVIKH
jgi:uncharacterized protein (DUF2141 family)